VEHLNERIRATARNVKRWDDGRIVLRWVLVGVLEAARGFRRLKGHKDMNLLVAQLKQLGRGATRPAVDASRSAA
jgi:putative transposase